MYDPYVYYNNTGYGNNVGYVESPVNRVGSSSGSGTIVGVIVVLLIFILALVVCVLIYVAYQKRRDREEEREREPSRDIGESRLDEVKEQARDLDLKITDQLFWDSVKPGSTLYLKDSQAMQDLVKLKGDGKVDADVPGLEHTVRSVGKFEQKGGIGVWCWARLKGPEQELFLMAKFVDIEVEFRVYLPQEDFRPGTRKELLESGEDWMFERARKGTPPSDMDFANAIARGGIDFTMKEQGVLYANLFNNPAQSGIPQPQFAVIVEYFANGDCDNPEMVAIELGGVGSSQGGEVSLYSGCVIREEEIEFTRLVSR
jgi:hypothetical protein